ncbi:MAG: calcium:sodium antiporter, partial [Proteobacteria bacterium]|nr:calcium:sodium antiporter [Pseudomonadota bacterium]
MDLTINIFLLLLGISILVWGANKFVDHASVIAKHMGISDLVIGLTLIAFGTS